MKGWNSSKEHSVRRGCRTRSWSCWTNVDIWTASVEPSGWTNVGLLAFMLSTFNDWVCSEVCVRLLGIANILVVSPEAISHSLLIFPGPSHLEFSRSPSSKAVCEDLVDIFSQIAVDTWAPRTIFNNIAAISRATLVTGTRSKAISKVRGFHVGLLSIRSGIIPVTTGTWGDAFAHWSFQDKP